MRVSRSSLVKVGSGTNPRLLYSNLSSGSWRFSRRSIFSNRSAACSMFSKRSTGMPLALHRSWITWFLVDPPQVATARASVSSSRDSAAPSLACISATTWEACSRHSACSAPIGMAFQMRACRSRAVSSSLS